MNENLEKIYLNLLKNPTQKDFIALSSTTKNQYKSERLLALLNFLKEQEIPINTSILLYGSNIWGYDKLIHPNDTNRKPNINSDIDLLFVTDTFPEFSFFSSEQISDIVKQHWKKGKITQLTCYTKISNIPISAKIIKPQNLFKICNLEPYIDIQYRYIDHEYKQQKYYYGYGFFKRYSFRIEYEPFDCGYLIKDYTNTITTKNGQFILGQLHNKVLTGGILIDNHKLSSAKNSLRTLIQERFKTHINKNASIIKCFSHILEFMSEEYINALKKYIN